MALLLPAAAETKTSTDPTSSFALVDGDTVKISQNELKIGKKVYGIDQFFSSSSN